MDFESPLMQLRDNGQNDGRRISRFVKYRLVSLVHLRLPTIRLHGVQVPIKSREVAAGDFQADPMLWLENVAGYTGIYVDLVGLVL